MLQKEVRKRTRTNQDFEKHKGYVFAGSTAPPPCVGDGFQPCWCVMGDVRQKLFKLELCFYSSKGLRQEVFCFFFLFFFVAAMMVDLEMAATWLGVWWVFSMALSHSRFDLFWDSCGWWVIEIWADSGNKYQGWRWLVSWQMFQRYVWLNWDSSNLMFVTGGSWFSGDRFEFRRSGKEWWCLVAFWLWCSCTVVVLLAPISLISLWSFSEAWVDILGEESRLWQLFSWFF